jgi:5-methylcytosine-specific restriction endonuclease McrA
MTATRHKRHKQGTPWTLEEIEERRNWWKQYRTLEKRKRREQYRALRNDLIKEMGGVCEICGSDYKLEFDHKNWREWKLEKVNYLKRIRIYWEEYRRGELRLLCKECNQFRWKKKEKNNEGANTGDARSDADNAVEAEELVARSN